MYITNRYYEACMSDEQDDSYSKGHHRLGNRTRKRAYVTEKHGHGHHARKREQHVDEVRRDSSAQVYYKIQVCVENQRRKELGRDVA